MNAVTIYADAGAAVPPTEQDRLLSASCHLGCPTLTPVIVVPILYFL